MTKPYLSFPVTLIALAFAIAASYLNVYLSERLNLSDPSYRIKLGMLYMLCIVSGFWFGSCLGNDIYYVYQLLTSKK